MNTFFSPKGFQFNSGFAKVAVAVLRMTVCAKFEVCASYESLC
jgi:hypothetical protein